MQPVFSTDADCICRSIKNNISQTLDYNIVVKQYDNLKKFYEINHNSLLQIYKNEMDVYDDIIRCFYTLKNNAYNLKIDNNYTDLYNFRIPSTFKCLEEQSKKDVVVEKNILRDFVSKDLINIITNYSNNEEYILNNYIEQYFFKQDVIVAICYMDEYTGNKLIRNILNKYCDVSNFKYVLSLLNTMYCQFSTFEILYQVYKSAAINQKSKYKMFNNEKVYLLDVDTYECENKEETEDAIDMNVKFCKKETIYQFWLDLHEQQHRKILNWYNAKKPEEVMRHPCNRYHNF